MATPQRVRPEYDRTPGAVYRLRYHVYWVVKRRRKVLVGPVRERLLALVRAKCAELGFVLDAVGVSADHVHVFIGAGPKWAPAEVVRRLKGATSRLLRKEFPHLMKMKALWSPSYFVRAVGGGNEDAVKRYVENQT